MLFLFIIVFFSLYLWMMDLHSHLCIYIIHPVSSIRIGYFFFCCRNLYRLFRDSSIFYNFKKKNTALGSRAVFCLEGLPMKNVLWISFEIQLRGQDLNLRPSGYEPDEMPGFSTPLRSMQALFFGELARACNNWKKVRWYITEWSPDKRSFLLVFFIDF